MQKNKTEKKVTGFETLAQKAAAYLVFAFGCEWDGSSGYTVADTITDAIACRPKAVLEPEAVSRRGKILVCRESSSSAPFGGKTVFVALTTREKILVNRAAYKTVEAFASRCARRTATV